MVSLFSSKDYQVHVDIFRGGNFLEILHSKVLKWVP